MDEVEKHQERLFLSLSGPTALVVWDAVLVHGRKGLVAGRAGICSRCWTVGQSGTHPKRISVFRAVLSNRSL